MPAMVREKPRELVSVIVAAVLGFGVASFPVGTTAQGESSSSSSSGESSSSSSSGESSSSSSSGESSSSSSSGESSSSSSKEPNTERPSYSGPSGTGAGNDEKTEQEDFERSATGSGPGIPIDVNVSAKRVLIPVAVPDTKEPGGDTGDVADRVEEILRRDLKLSGFFKVLPPDNYFFDTDEEGMAPLDIEFKNWFNIGAQGLIKSAVRREGDEVRLDLRLFEVDTEQRVQLNWSGGAVDENDYEQKVHEFVNAVLEYYTGTEGVFGTKIAFVKRDSEGRKQIVISGMDGSDRNQITNNDSINMLPSWGNGAVYYTSYAHQNPDLWRYKEGQNNKISSQPGQNTGAAYCGGRLAVTLSMGGENADIYLIDPLSGDRERRLTDNWAIDTSPTWSPDCSKIAFVSGRSGSPQIYVMNADGSNKERLTFKGTYNTSPDWSPKGKKIAFTARDKFNRFDVFLVDLDGNLKRLTQDQGNNENPSFSPDGRYIIFSSDRGGQGKRLWLMTRDGQIQNPITPDESGLSAPAWKK